VIVYVAFPGDPVALVSVCAIVVPVPETAPEIPAPLPATQVNVVPAVRLLKLIDVVNPEQMVAEEGVATATGVGLTVTTIETGDPGQEFAEGITLYVTVPAEAPVAVNVCVMLAPLPAAPPEAAVCVGAAQLKVVPARFPDNEMLVAVPEQIDCEAGLGVATGNGLTVIGTVIGLPGQPPDVELIV
jgi:hypothetical protein